MQSLVTPFGYSAESCGYCKDGSTGRRTPNSRASYYLTSKCMTVQVYQALVDRGWRRSGTIFYKPDVLRHCCPHYTIRLPAADFTPGKEHRQAVNRWNRFVLGEEYIKDAARRYPKTKQEKAKQKNTFDLATAVHESEHDTLKRPPEPAHRFEVTLEPDDFTLEKYELFRNYQQSVHKEDPSEVSQTGFKRFLCGSPLTRTTAVVDGKTRQYGSYHQCYRLDGRLIAMGVVDLLPHCVSGVYLIYHSDFEKWSFGKLSALRELTLALEEGYQYYYMGYYIHSCVKMRYKGDYKPQYLLDPETHEWDPLDGELRGLLDAKPYVSLSRERKLKDAIAASIQDHGKMEDSDLEPRNSFPMPTAESADLAIVDGMSLFDLKVPGMMTAEEVEAQINLDEQAIKVRGVPMPLAASNLVAWDSGHVRDPKSIKGLLAEMAAFMGPEVAGQVVVDFG